MSPRAEAPQRPGHRVVVVTGGLISGDDRSVWRALRKWWTQWRSADSAWLDVKVKLLTLEPLLTARLERMLARLTRRGAARAVGPYLDGRKTSDTPTLTEVVLASALEAAGMPWTVLSIDELFTGSARARRVLEGADCVFLSSTYLHDLSELLPLVRRLRRPHNRVVVGGALAGVIHDRWPGSPDVDVLAIGYGELLVPALVEWIRSGFRTLHPPPRGRVVDKAHTRFLFSGVPASKSLDDLPRPDWSLALPPGARALPMVYYESVRGCPYRCSFCNYPFLFDDTRFRFKSARRIADDWQHYVEELGVEVITCLDSLFTIPRTRLEELCHLLIERRIDVRWTCYARADDLADERTVVLMKRAGARQVQIGIESGDAGQLARMNKRCDVEANARALRNCRAHGLTSVVSLIVGFPGETADTLERTYRFLEATPPDFYFLATFSTRVAGVPVLQPAEAGRFGLRVDRNLHNLAPYWWHDTMSCAEVGRHVRALDRRLMANRVALNAAVFYRGLIDFHAADRERLLDFQMRVARRHPLLRGGFSCLNALVDRALARDVGRRLGAVEARSAPGALAARV